MRIMCNNSDALNALVLSIQQTTSNCLKLMFAVNSGQRAVHAVRRLGMQFQAAGPATEQEANLSLG